MDRRATANSLRRLGDEALLREPSLGTLLGRLADAVADGRATEARGYIDAIDARGLAELLAGGHSRVWAVLEVLRNVLVFAPIAVTWLGLSLAAGAYAQMLAARPELVSQPFLLLWEQGFGGRLLFNFGTLALIDASLIGVLIALSLALFTRSELRGRAVRARVLLKESEIRALLGEASSVSTLALSDPDAETALTEMAAEERRIYERAMEREGQLFNLEAAIRELKEAAARLDRASETIAKR